jgi:hypothetical protein
LTHFHGRFEEVQLNNSLGRLKKDFPQRPEGVLDPPVKPEDDEEDAGLPGFMGRHNCCSSVVSGWRYDNHKNEFFPA